MPTLSDFSPTKARRSARLANTALFGVADSILIVAAGSYGFRSGLDETTLPTGFDPQAAALFEAIVEASFLAATAGTAFDDAQTVAFRTAVFEACRGYVTLDTIDILTADLANQLDEDGLDCRIESVASTISPTEQQLDVLRIAILLAFASSGMSDCTRDVIEKIGAALKLKDVEVASVLKEVATAIAEASKEADTQTIDDANEMAP